MYPHVGEAAAYERIRDLRREAAAERQAMQARRARRRSDAAQGKVAERAGRRSRPAGMVRSLRAFLAYVRV
jgi:hypothetical protein